MGNEPLGDGLVIGGNREHFQCGWREGQGAFLFQRCLNIRSIAFYGTELSGFLQQEYLQSVSGFLVSSVQVV